MKPNPISRLVRAIPALGISILLLGQFAFADALDNWTTNQLSTNWFELGSVVYGNGRYVAYGSFSDAGVIMSSEDGYNWVLRLNGSTNGFSFGGTIVNTGAGFLALGQFGTSGFSTNGTNWVVFGLDSLSPRGAASRPGQYVIVGADCCGTSDQNIFTSADGITWTARHSQSPSGAILTDIAYGAGRYVALGGINGSVNDSGHIYRSTTGTLWGRSNFSVVYQITFCNGIFIASLSAGTNLVSADGISWAAISTGIPSQIGKPFYANGLFVASAGNPYSGLGPYYLATSTDGTNWVQYPQIIPGKSLATDGSRLVTVAAVFVAQPWSYNSFAYVSEPLISIRMTNTAPPKVVLSGLVGRSYRIEATDNLTAGTNAWQTLTTLQLPNTPYLFTDATATNSSQRFYRGVLLP